MVHQQKSASEMFKWGPGSVQSHVEWVAPAEAHAGRFPEGGENTRAASGQVGPGQKGTKNDKMI